MTVLNFKQFLKNKETGKTVRTQNDFSAGKTFLGFAKFGNFQSGGPATANFTA